MEVVGYNAGVVGYNAGVVEYNVPALPPGVVRVHRGGSAVHCGGSAFCLPQLYTKITSTKSNCEKDSLPGQFLLVQYFWTKSYLKVKKNYVWTFHLFFSPLLPNVSTAGAFLLTLNMDTPGHLESIKNFKIFCTGAFIDAIIE